MGEGRVGTKPERDFRLKRNWRGGYERAVFANYGDIEVEVVRSRVWAAGDAPVVLGLVEPLLEWACGVELGERVGGLVQRLVSLL